MAHGDDDGLRLPPRIAPKHVIIIPVVPKPEAEASVFAYADKLAKQLKTVSYAGQPIVVHVDKRDIRGGEKSWQWIKRGAPIRIEVGPRDIEGNAAMLYRRDRPHKDKNSVSIDSLPGAIPPILEEMQKGYYDDALKNREANIRRDITSYDEFRAFFTPKNAEKPEIHGGFVIAKWCCEDASLSKLEDLKVTIRCIPFEQSGTTGTCVLTGKPATTEALFAKAY